MYKNKSILAAAVLASAAAVSTTAHAGDFIDAWERTSQVTDAVTDNGGSFSYEYTVINTSTSCDPFAQSATECFFTEGVFGVPVIIDWELPYFSDAQISNIVSPEGWAYAIETIGVANPLTGWGGNANWQSSTDPFFAGAGSPFTTATQVLHWYVTNPQACQPFAQTDVFAVQVAAVTPSCAGILADGIDQGLFGGVTYHQPSLAGFGFDSVYDETAAPYQASWLIAQPRTGDPAFPLGGVPNSPTLSGIVPDPTVPVPAPLALLALGALGLAFRARR